MYPYHAPCLLLPMYCSITCALTSKFAYHNIDITHKSFARQHGRKIIATKEKLQLKPKQHARIWNKTQQKSRKVSKPPKPGQCSRCTRTESSRFSISKSSACAEVITVPVAPSGTEPSSVRLTSPVASIAPTFVAAPAPAPAPAAAGSSLRAASERPREEASGLAPSGQTAPSTKYILSVSGSHTYATNNPHFLHSFLHCCSFPVPLFKKTVGPF